MKSYLAKEGCWECNLKYRERKKQIFSAFKKPIGVSLQRWLEKTVIKLCLLLDPYGPLHAEKLAETVLLYLFNIAFPASLFQISFCKTHNFVGKL